MVDPARCWNYHSIMRIENAGQRRRISTHRKRWGTWHLFCSLALVALILSGCTPYQDERLPGTIIVTGSNFLVYDASIGRVAMTDWGDGLFRPKVIAQSWDGAILLDAERTRNHDQRTGGEEFGYFIYKWTPCESLRPMDHYTDRISNCRSLDPDFASGQYLLAGCVDSTWGVYLLDTAFQVISKLGFTRGGVDLGRDVMKAYRLDGGQVLLECSSGMFLCGEGTEPEQLWSHSARLLAVSQDRGSMLVTEGSEDKMRLQLFRMPQRTSTVLNITDKDIGRAAFSPDGRFIALIWSTHNLGNMNCLMIYDLSTGELHNTWVTGWGELLWVPQRILSGCVSPFHIDSTSQDIR
jgi:hypothetical protein